VDVLKEEPSTTAVYRLHLRDGTTTVIAKRSRRSTASVEETVYASILPILPLRRLHYYGSVAESSGEFCWLFIEEAHGRSYRPSREADRTAAALWLATLHRSIGEPPAAHLLPARDSEHYRGLLRAQRATLVGRISGPDLHSDERAALEAVVEHYDQLTARWTELDEACKVLPYTLVHGDFINHNVFVRSEESRLVLLPFDWEKAGWGTPAEDLSSVDVDTYWRFVQEDRPGLELAGLQRLARVGRVLRCLVFLDWAIPRLGKSGDATALDDIRLCSSWLDQLVGPAPTG